jgi:hypothetical protein
LFRQAAHATLQAITFRNEAAGCRLTKDEIEDLAENPVSRASQRDPSAWEELGNLWDDLLPDYVKNYNEEVSRKDNLASQLDNKRRAIAYSRYLSVSIQMLAYLSYWGPEHLAIFLFQLDEPTGRNTRCYALPLEAYFGFLSV